MRLTKGNRKKILENNEGFSTNTSYDSRNYSFDRRYNIRDGKLHIEETRKTSWADSREERKWVADEKETHDFLYKHKDDLDLDGLE